jgi:myo-inositol 2-dehydrogenase/D-chiro-inositol 1-dehydrogenase
MLHDFLTRWHEAYINEITEFCTCILENRKPEVTVYDGTAVSRIAYRCKESFETGKMLAMADA